MRDAVKFRSKSDALYLIHSYLKPNGFWHLNLKLVRLSHTCVSNDPDAGLSWLLANLSR